MRKSLYASAFHFNATVCRTYSVKMIFNIRYKTDSQLGYRSTVNIKTDLPKLVCL